MLDFWNPASMWQNYSSPKQVKGGHLPAETKSDDLAGSVQPSSHEIKAVFRFFNSQVNSYQDAENLTETTFILVQDSLLARNQPDPRSLSQLFQVARKLLNDYHQEKPAARIAPEQSDGDIYSTQTDHSQSRERNQEQEKLRQALHKLNEDHQTVLVSRFMSGLSIEETAQMMGRKLDSVLILQHQALCAINQILG